MTSPHAACSEVYRGSQARGVERVLQALAGPNLAFPPVWAPQILPRLTTPFTCSKLHAPLRFDPVTPLRERFGRINEPLI